MTPSEWSFVKFHIWYFYKIWRHIPILVKSKNIPWRPKYVNDFSLWFIFINETASVVWDMRWHRRKCRPLQQIDCKSSRFPACRVQNCWRWSDWHSYCKHWPSHGRSSNSRQHKLNSRKWGSGKCEIYASCPFYSELEKKNISQV